jgi:hypothetical protein
MSILHYAPYPYLAPRGLSLCVSILKKLILHINNKYTRAHAHTQHTKNRETGNMTQLQLQLKMGPSSLPTPTPLDTGIAVGIWPLFQMPDLPGSVLLFLLLFWATCGWQSGGLVVWSGSVQPASGHTWCSLQTNKMLSDGCLTKLLLHHDRLRWILNDGTRGKTKARKTRNCDYQMQLARAQVKQKVSSTLLSAPTYSTTTYHLPATTYHLPPTTYHVLFHQPPTTHPPPPPTTC